MYFYFKLLKMTLSIFQVDAFTDRLFGGNPAAVCPLNSWLEDELMQAIAAENNLSETAFFVPYEDGSFNLRWFTPVKEVDLCGHATLATAHVLYQHLGYSQPSIRFYSRSGWLSVSYRDQVYTLDFPVDNISLTETPPALREGLGLNPLEVWQGREDLLAIVETEAQVAALEPDFVKLSQLDGRGVIVSAPGNQSDFVSRCFFPNFGINEDPVTGSAHTTLAPYWAGRLGKERMTARQISQRLGVLECYLSGDRVQISGRGVTFMAGSIFIPHTVKL